MTTKEKFDIAFERIATVCETVGGVEIEDITTDCIMGKMPSNMPLTDTATSKYIGLNDIDIMLFMFHIEETFDTPIDDVNFIPLPTAIEKDLWANRPIGDLAEYCATLIDDE